MSPRDTTPPFAGLDGQVAAVTGAGGGIGAAIALELGTAGAAIVLNDRLADGLGRTADAARAAGTDVSTVVADVSTRDGARTLAREAIDRFGSLSILVNVVGGMRGEFQTPFVRIDDDAWDFAMRINLRTTFQCMQAALDVMIPNGTGSIVNIASTAWAGSPDNAAYSAAKAGVVALTRSVATQVGPHGITVNVVAPGVTATDAVRRASPLVGESTEVPLGRPNEPGDVAAAVRFLVSSAARNISGQLVTVAGGWNPSL